jgi:uncharacterized protein (TIGR02145 family)
MKNLLILLLITPVIVHAQGEQLYADGTATDQDGNTFEWINYGTQDWVIENAEVVTYSDGTPIPQVTDAIDWENLTTGAWCYSNNDSTNEKYYNWYAVMGIHDNDENTPNKKFAPEGWQVPSKDDFTILKDYLIENGYNSNINSSQNLVAKSMSSISGWDESNMNNAVGNNQETNNKSGFNILPVGYVRTEFDNLFVGRFGRFWTSSVSSSEYAWDVYTDWRNGRFAESVSNSNKLYGLSVRLVRDAQTASTKDYSKPAAIYPNPTTSIVTIKGGEAYNIEVYSLQGRKLLTHIGNSIDLSALSNAIYLIKATNSANKQQQIYKVIKE